MATNSLTIKDSALRRCANGETAAAVARSLGLSPRTVQVWRKEQAEQHAPVDRSSLQIDIPHFRPNDPDEIAHDRTQWRDPWSGELMQPPPGSRRAEWERERTLAKSRKEFLMSSSANQDTNPEAETTNPTSESDAPRIENPASESTDSHESPPIYRERPGAQSSEPPSEVVIVNKRPPQRPPTAFAVLWPTTVRPNIFVALAIVLVLIALCQIVR